MYNWNITLHPLCLSWSQRAAWTSSGTKRTRSSWGSGCLSQSLFFKSGSYLQGAVSPPADLPAKNTPAFSFLSSLCSTVAMVVKFTLTSLAAIFNYEWNHWVPGLAQQKNKTFFFLNASSISQALCESEARCEGEEGRGFCRIFSL